MVLRTDGLCSRSGRIAPVWDGEQFAIAQCRLVRSDAGGHIAHGFPDVDGWNAILGDRFDEFIGQIGVRAAMSAIKSEVWLTSRKASITSSGSGSRISASDTGVSDSLSTQVSFSKLACVP